MNNMTMYTLILKKQEIIYFSWKSTRIFIKYCVGLTMTFPNVTSLTKLGRVRPCLQLKV